MAKYTGHDDDDFDGDGLPPPPPNPEDRGRNRGGRPTKLTPLLQQRILMMLRKACTLERTFKTCGISERTFRRWMAQGRRFPTGSYGRFRRDAETALASSVNHLAMKVFDAADDGDMASARWLLSRRASDDYGDHTPELQAAMKEVERLKKLVAELVASDREAERRAAGD